ncbi:MAG: thioredoxin family protein [Candidatus Delongbacteria bacterium]|nr:thioredoxin family protein [Candidatus Delongbacteria bacterium]
MFILNHLRQARHWLPLLLCALYLGPPFASAQSFDPVRAVPVELQFSHTAYTPGMSGQVAVLYHVPENHHITDVENGLFYVEFDTITQVEITDIIYPPGILDAEQERIYRGVVPILLHFQLNDAPADLDWELRAGYQVCSEIGDLTCYMPIEKSLPFDPVITDDPDLVEPVTATWFGPAATADLESKLQKALGGNLLLAFLIIFIGGLLSSFTPCVYPVIPVTISYIGAHSGKSRFSGFFLSLFFVIGLALVFSVLGLIAAAGGSSFGSIGQSAVIQFIVAGIFLLLAASMFGAYEIQLPSSWLARMQTGAKAGPLGAVIMGGITGFIAAPCVGPIIGVLLVYIASTGNLLLGFFMMLVYALGMGVLFLVIGTFAGALNSLPQAGGWMDTIKNFFGVIMVTMAIYFVRLYIPPTLLLLLIGVWIIIVAVYMGAFTQLREDSTFTAKLFKAIGLALLVAGLYFTAGGLIKAWPLGLWSPAGTTLVNAVPEVEVEWSVNNRDEVFTLAGSTGKPVMMDFYADWCVACKELDDNTWNQPAVVALAERFMTIKMDFSARGDWEKEMRSRFEVFGMPTVIFFAPDGRETDRFVGFRKPDRVLPLMETALQQAR